jgi:hypothetical protein
MSSIEATMTPVSSRPGHRLLLLRNKKDDDRQHPRRYAEVSAANSPICGDF